MIFRSELPQLSASVLEGKGIAFESITVTPHSIKPLQSDRLPFDDSRYLDRYTKITTNTYKPLVVDQDFNLIDGHHRYDIIQRTKIKSVRVLRVEITYLELLELLKK